MSPPKLNKSASLSSDLFGSDDPEFLEALSRAALPTIATYKVPIGLKQSSSDLFGSEDSSFLDALSKAALPGDIQPSPQPVQGTSSNPIAIKQPAQSRKRPRSPEQELAPSSYMHRKRAKSSIQNTEIEESTGDNKGTLFQGLALHVYSKTNPSVQELRKLIIQHGGSFHPYFDHKGTVTHIIASNITASKVLEFKSIKVVTPAWLLESVKAGTLLPWRDFAIGAATRFDESQIKVRKATQGTSAQITVDDINAGQPATPQTANDSPSKGSPRSLYSIDPGTRGETARFPKYAASGSNPHAKSKMQNPEWRAAHTAVAPGFIEGYYRNSRLHHLSTWKAELQELVAKAVERVENGDEPEGLVGESSIEGTTSMHGTLFRKPTSPRKGTEKTHPESKVIMHCDFDAFFVSAGLVDRPHLRDKPVVVCHSQGASVTSTSEVSSSSYEARKFGIKNGMSLGQAKQLCPDVCTIPYEFERYKQLSFQFYTILMSYADDLQAVSVDEALMDVTSTVEHVRDTVQATESDPSPDYAKELAETIRARVRAATGCQVSIGISHNIMLARVATRLAKPAGSYHIAPSQDVSELLAPLDIDDLRGFGWSTRKKVETKFGVTTLGELARRPKGALCDVLGKKTGETLWKAIRGIDDTKIESDRVRKSVSCEMNYGIRFENNEEAEKFVLDMAVEVSKRMANIEVYGRLLTLKIMTRDSEAPVEAPKFLGHGICDTTNKSSPLADPGGRATSDETVIGECAWRLLKGMHLDPKELRGIGIQVQKLERAGEGSRGAGQSVLKFKKADVVKESSTIPLRDGDIIPGPVVVVEPPSQDSIREDLPSPRSDHLQLPDAPSAGLHSLSLPSDVRAELDREYDRTDSGQPVAGPSRQKTPPPLARRSLSPAKRQDKNKTPDPARTNRQLAPKLGITISPSKNYTDLARITRQLAPRSRPSFSPNKDTHPLFVKRTTPWTTPQVSPTELRLLDIDPEVWACLPIELQREQLAASRAANVGTGMALRANMSTWAKQEQTLDR